MEVNFSWIAGVWKISEADDRCRVWLSEFPAVNDGSTGSLQDRSSDHIKTLEDDSMTWSGYTPEISHGTWNLKWTHGRWYFFWTSFSGSVLIFGGCILRILRNPLYRFYTVVFRSFCRLYYACCHTLEGKHEQQSPVDKTLWTIEIHRVFLW